MTKISEVLTKGAAEYGDYNWNKGLLYHRLYRAAIGHIWSWWARDPIDKDTGLPHLAHAVCCLLFLLQYELDGRPELDDRPTGFARG